VTFLHPEAWPWLLAAPLAALLFGWLERKRARSLAATLGPRASMLASNGGTPNRVWFLATATLFTALAMMQPAWGEGSRTVEERGVDLVVCLDVSRSMLARDDRPDRLARAQKEIAEVAKRAEGDRLALVLFAGEARLAVPLTRDRESMAMMAGLATPLSVARGGSDLGSALMASLQALEGATGEHEAILLVTDGEDLQQSGLRAARACANRGITVHTVGMGSRRGAKIPLQSEGGETYLRDAGGADVVTAMDPEGLTRIAEATGGAFIAAEDSSQPLIELYEEQVVPMARKAFESREEKERAHRFQWPLFAAFLFWLVDLGRCVRRRS